MANSNNEYLQLNARALYDQIEPVDSLLFRLGIGRKKTIAALGLPGVTTYDEVKAIRAFDKAEQEREDALERLEEAQAKQAERAQRAPLASSALARVMQAKEAATNFFHGRVSMDAAWKTGAGLLTAGVLAFAALKSGNEQKAAKNKPNTEAAFAPVNVSPAQNVLASQLSQPATEAAAHDAALVAAATPEAPVAQIKEPEPTSQNYDAPIKPNGRATLKKPAAKHAVAQKSTVHKKVTITPVVRKAAATADVAAPVKTAPVMTKSVAAAVAPAAQAAPVAAKPAASAPKMRNGRPLAPGDSARDVAYQATNGLYNLAKEGGVLSTILSNNYKTGEDNKPLDKQRKALRGVVNKQYSEFAKEQKLQFNAEHNNELELIKAKKALEVDNQGPLKDVNAELLTIALTNNAKVPAPVAGVPLAQYNRQILASLSTSRVLGRTDADNTRQFKELSKKIDNAESNQPKLVREAKEAAAERNAALLKKQQEIAENGVEVNKHAQDLAEKVGALAKDIAPGNAAIDSTLQSFIKSHAVKDAVKHGDAKSAKAKTKPEAKADAGAVKMQVVDSKAIRLAEKQQQEIAAAAREAQKQAEKARKQAESDSIKAAKAQHRAEEQAARNLVRATRRDQEQREEAAKAQAKADEKARVAAEKQAAKDREIAAKNSEAAAKQAAEQKKLDDAQRVQDGVKAMQKAQDEILNPQTPGAAPAKSSVEQGKPSASIEKAAEVSEAYAQNEKDAVKPVVGIAPAANFTHTGAANTQYRYVIK